MAPVRPRAGELEEVGAASQHLVQAIDPEKRLVALRDTERLANCVGIVNWPFELTQAETPMFSN